MPVNLLPQTPPQSPTGAKTTDAADDAGVPTFGASLTAARSAASTDARSARAPEASRRASDADPDQDAAAATLVALALLGVPGLVPSSPVPTSVAPAAGRAEAATLPTAAKGALLPQTGSAAERTTPEAVLRDALHAAPEVAAEAPNATLAEAPAKPETPKHTITGAAVDPAGSQRHDWREALTAALGASAARPSPEAVKSASADKQDATAPLASASKAFDDPNLAVTPPTPATTRPVQIDIATPALTPAWRSEVVDQMAQLVVMRQDTAEIRVHPQDLGPISVQIQFDGNSANLLIQAPQPATRDALDLALPQLRDALAQQGIALGQTSVRDDGGAAADRSARGTPSPKRTAAEVAPVDGARVVPLRGPLGLVDLFA